MMRCHFTDGLRFSPPANGGWNLAHICRLIPESHVLFATPRGCSRIILLSAAEKGLSGRFSTLDIRREDLETGNVERLIEAGAADVLGRLKERPKVFLIFTSCVDDFIGTDHQVYLDALGERFPEVRFLDCRMDPINRVGGMPPIVRMHNNIASLFAPNKKERAVNILGSFLPPSEENELVAHLAKNGIAVAHPYACRSYEELAAMGGSLLNLVVHPSALPAANALSQRLGQDWISLFTGNPFRDLPGMYTTICGKLGIPPVPRREEETARALSQAAVALSGWKLAIDDGATPFPYSLCSLLAQHGFSVRYLFADSYPPIEQEAILPPDTEVIQEDAPSLYAAFGKKTYFGERILAIGELAAYFCGTGHFLSRLSFGGEFGYHSLTALAGELVQAARHPRPLTDLMENGKGCMAL